MEEVLKFPLKSFKAIGIFVEGKGCVTGGHLDLSRPVEGIGAAEFTIDEMVRGQFDLNILVSQIKKIRIELSADIVV